VRAFISSTIYDLTDYRQAVRDVLTDLGVAYVALDDLVATEAPPPTTVAERVFQELADSDVVVLIIGHRYGSIEPSSGSGWVEAEFRAAKKLGKPILAFLADEQASFTAASIDEDRSRVERFRTEVLSNYLVTLSVAERSGSEAYVCADTSHTTVFRIHDCSCRGFSGETRPYCSPFAQFTWGRVR
jgi:hypothetical protein